MNEKMIFKVKKWRSLSGNECFQFPMRDSFEKPWIIILLTLLLILVTSVEYLINGTFYSFIPNLIFIPICFLLWMTYPLRFNERVIKKAVHDIMDQVAQNDTRSVGRRVIKSIVHHDTKGTYGIVTGSYFLVLLDNDEVWEYPIIYHRSKNVETGYFECVRCYTKSENKSHIQKVNPRKWKNFAEKMKMSDESKLRVLIMEILVAGGIVVGLFCWILYAIKWWSLLALIGYSVVITILKWISTKVTGRKRRIISRTIYVLGFAIYACMHLAHSFLTIIGTYVLVFLYVFGLPAIVLFMVTKFCDWSCRLETIAFLVLSIGSILCTHSYSITRWVIRQTPLRDWGNHLYENYREQLAIYLIHPSNVVFLLYLMYFIFLAVSGYLQIQLGNSLISKEFDFAILKAFLVFIAFTNMRTKAVEADMDVRELLKRTLLLFVHDNWRREKEGQGKSPDK